MTSFVRQVHFGGGELAPSLWGRSDLDIFAAGLKTCRNFFVDKHGMALSRPGSTLVAYGIDASTYAKLIPFVQDDSTSFVLEFNGGGRLAFHQNGAPLLSAFVPFFIAHPYNANDLSGLQFAQVGDVLTLTHRSYAPMELRRWRNWDPAGIGVIQTEALAAGAAAAFAVAEANVGVQASGYAPMSSRALAASNVHDNAIWAQGWWPAFSADARAAYVAAFRAVFAARGSNPTVEASAHAAGAAAAVAALPGTSSVDTVDAAYAAAYLSNYSAAVMGTPHWTLTPVVYANTLTPFWRDTDALATPTLPPMIVNASISVVTPTGTVAVGGNVGDATHPPREWVIQATQRVQHTASGMEFETLPFTLAQSFDGINGNGTGHADAPTALPAGGMLAIYPDRPIVYRRALSANPLQKPPDWSAYRVLSTQYYRGRGKLMGLIGSTKTRDFIDTGAEPNYAIQPPQGTDPFTVVTTAGVVSRVEHPAAVAFFQERRVFGGTAERGGFVFASATGNYTDYDTHLVQVSGEALILELAARRRERIVNMVSANRLVILTGSSSWSLGGTQNQPLDFDSVEARLEEEIGSIGLQALIVESSILFARAKGAGVRSLDFDARSLTYQGKDISDAASHLFLGKTSGLPLAVGGPTVTKALVDWTYAEDPFRMVWAVRSDGALLSLSYGASHEAWSRHDTDGYYRSICSVPEGDEDAVYVFVVRAVGGSAAIGCVERFTSRHRRGDAYDDGAVDCAFVYTGAPTAIITSTGMAHLMGRTVWVTGVGNAPVSVVVGLDAATGLLPSITLPEAPTANYDPAGGTSYTQVVLYIGLGYTCDLELLDVIGTDVRAKQKTLVSVTFEVDQSRGLSIGQDFEHLTKWEQRQVNNSYLASPAATALVRLPVLGTWDKSARACIRQTLPLPVSVLGITREIDIGS